MTMHECGTGYLRVSYARDANGRLKWLEIVTEEEAVFRADEPPRESDLELAIHIVNLVNARQAQYAEVAA